MTFREWITSLRLEYAKNILKKHPEINIQKLAESSGFLSQSNFIKLFSEKEGCTPAKWKKSNREYLCSKKTSEKVTETYFQKVLIRQKDAQTTLFIKFYSKSFSNLLGIE